MYMITLTYKGGNLRPTEGSPRMRWDLNFSLSEKKWTVTPVLQTERPGLNTSSTLGQITPTLKASISSSENENSGTYSSQGHSEAPVKPSSWGFYQFLAHGKHLLVPLGSCPERETAKPRYQVPDFSTLTAHCTWGPTNAADRSNPHPLSNNTTRLQGETRNMTHNSICTNSNSTKSYSTQRYVQLEVSTSEIETFLLGLHSKPE